MGKTCIELVPRDEAALLIELQLVREAFPAVDIINIPDLLKFPLRSWEGCRLAKEFFTSAIPHLRAIDFDLEKPLPFLEHLCASGIDEVLVIAGDQPQDMSRRVFRTTSAQLIHALKEQRPELKVYAGVDQYRSGFKTELDYARQKLDAGADGFFTQPFFDGRLLEIWHDLLGGSEVYWGVSPVMSQRSRSYWENLNNAIFPPDFEPTLEWNRRFALETLEFCQSRDSHVYFMPIRVDIKDYLAGILS